jgi:hypothetical protein
MQIQSFQLSLTLFEPTSPHLPFISKSSNFQSITLLLRCQDLITCISLSLLFYPETDCTAFVGTLAPLPLLLLAVLRQHRFVFPFYCLLSLEIDATTER